MKVIVGHSMLACRDMAQQEGLRIQEGLRMCDWVGITPRSVNSLRGFSIQESDVLWASPREMMPSEVLEQLDYALAISAAVSK
jgi:hypothetical protein